MATLYDENGRVREELTEEISQRLFNKTLDDVYEKAYDLIDIYKEYEEIVDENENEDENLLYLYDSGWESEGYPFQPYRNTLIIMRYEGNVLRIMVGFDGIEHEYGADIDESDIQVISGHTQEEYEEFLAYKQREEDERIQQRNLQNLQREDARLAREREQEQRELERTREIRANIEGLTDRDRRFYQFLKIASDKRSFDKHFGSLKPVIRESYPTFSHITVTSDDIQHNRIGFKVYIKVRGNKINTGFECVYNFDNKRLMVKPYQRFLSISEGIKTIVASLYFDDFSLLRTPNYMTIVATIASNYRVNRELGEVGEAMNLSIVMPNGRDYKKELRESNRLSIPLNKPLAYYQEVDAWAGTTYRIEYELKN